MSNQQGKNTRLSAPEAIREFAATAQTLLPETEVDTPLTTPEIFGRTRAENVWHSYLAYFIDPEKPHGFNDRFLEAFLNVCADHNVVDEQHIHPELSHVMIESEIGIDTGGIPDMLVFDRGEWFVLLELKVNASEGDSQTEDYAKAETIGSIEVADYPEDARHYGYIAPQIPNSIDEAFVGIEWSDIGNAFEETQQDLDLVNYPVKSVAQLDDFISTMSTTMAEIDEETRELAELYFKYREEMSAAEQAVEKLVDDVLQYEWTKALMESESAPEFWDDSWYIEKQGTSQGQFARDSWKLPNGVHVHFQHDLSSSSFESGDFKMTLDLEMVDSSSVEDGKSPRVPFRRRFVELVNEADLDLPSSTDVDDGSGEISTYQRLMTCYYSYEPGDLEGYYDVLQRACEDHAEFIPIVDALFEAYPETESATL